MASSTSSSLLFLTTAPAYAPTTVFPSAATYYTSAFPYAGAYLPPADAYTPASANGFSPNWPNWPPPSPDPTLSTTTISATPTFSCVRFSPPPPAEMSATTPTRRRDRVPSVTLHPARSSSPTPTSPPSPRQRVAPPQRKTMARPRATTVLARPVRATAPSTPPCSTSGANAATSPRATKPGARPSMAFTSAPVPEPSPGSTTSPNHRLTMEDDAAVQVPADERSQVKDVTNHMLQREFINIQTRLDQQWARDPISCDTIQGEIARLSAAFARLDSSVCKKNNSSSEAASTNEASDDSPNSQPQGRHNYSSNIAATAYGNHKVPGEMRQSYGFNTLISQSVFLADGTERRYYALPEDYPLESSSVVGKVGVTVPPCVAEQATGLAPILCSKANITAGSESLLIPNLQLPMDVQDDPHVFKEAPIYDTYEEEDSASLNTTSNVQDFTSEQQPYKEQQESGQLLKCVGMAPVFDVYDSDGCSNEFVHVFSSTPEQQPYEEETQDSEQHLKCVGKATQTEETTACLNYISGVFGFTSELQEQDDERAGNCSVLKASNSFVSRSSQLSIEHSMRERRLLWDPGASALLHSSNAKPPRELGYVAMLVPEILTLCIKAGSYVQQLRDSSWSVLVTRERRKEWHPGDTNLHVLFTTAARATELECTDIYKYAMVQALAVQLGARKALISESALMRSYAFGPGCLVVPCFTSTSAAERFLLLSSGDNNKTSHSILNLLLQSLCATPVVQVTECLQYVAPDINSILCDASFILQRAAYLSQFNYLCSLYYNSVLKTEYIGMRYVRAFSLEKGRHVQWDPGIEFILYERWWLSQETEYVLKHLQVVNSGIWDTGSMLLHCESVWLPNGSEFRDGRLDTSINSSEWVTNWTTTPSVAIRSFEYGYTMDSLNGQYEFMHQRGVQENHNAKQLLVSSMNCLHIWEMDILFITFLPP